MNCQLWALWVKGWMIKWTRLYADQAPPLVYHWWNSGLSEPSCVKVTREQVLTVTTFMLNKSNKGHGSLRNLSSSLPSNCYPSSLVWLRGEFTTLQLFLHSGNNIKMGTVLPNRLLFCLKILLTHTHTYTLSTSSLNPVHPYSVL